MNKLHQALLPLLALALAHPARAETTSTLEPSDRAAIERIVADEVAAWNKGDAVAFSKHVFDDCIFTNTVGMVAVGTAAFEKQHRLIFGSIYKGSHASLKITHARALAADVAIVDTDTTVAGTKWLPPGALVVNGAVFSRLEQVLVKRNGVWGITSYHNVFVAADR